VEGMVMRGEIGVCALETGYTRWDQFIRDRKQLCAVDSIYTRSKTVMRAGTNLYAIKNSYARWDQFIRD